MADARPGPSVRARVRVIEDGAEGRRDVFRRDDVATEEPLEIRLNAGAARRTVAVTMRTPGHDFELVAGYLLAEGVIGTADDLVRVDYCTDLDVTAEQQYNVVTAGLRSPVMPEPDTLDRHGYTSSACGVCGKASIDALEVRCAPISVDCSLDVDTLYALPDRLRAAQGVFQRTGGLHAAGLMSLAGDVLVAREDVGRHNAVDKVLGHTLLHATVPVGPGVLMVSGRTSFEIVQKAIAAGVPIVAGVSAPSSLAVSLAERLGVTLVGFLRGRKANVYSHADRIRA
jgi:FdhD protein